MRYNFCIFQCVFMVSRFDLSGSLPTQSVKFRSLDCQLNCAGFFFAGLIELHEVDILEIRFCL